MKTHYLLLLLPLVAIIPPEPAQGQMVLANYNLGQTEDILSEMMADYADSEWTAFELSERHAALVETRDPAWGWMLDEAGFALLVLEYTRLPAVWAEVECGVALYGEINELYWDDDFAGVNALFPSMEACRDRLLFKAGRVRVYRDGCRSVFDGLRRERHPADVNRVRPPSVAGIDAAGGWLLEDDTMSEQTLKALNSVATCSTWHISYSSEGCSIKIGGVPVLLECGEPLVEFYSGGPWTDLAEAIRIASHRFDEKCYPHRLESGDPEPAEYKPPRPIEMIDRPSEAPEPTQPTEEKAE